jgi:type I restriction enzyme S subunit
MVNMGELFAHTRIINVSMDRVPLTEFEREKSLLKSGDLLFARQSLVLSGAGKCSIFLYDDEEVCFESHIIRCRLNNELADPNFYYYYFLSPMGRSNVETIVEQGAGVSGIRGSDLAKLNVPYIDLCLQKEAVRILSSIDDKIANNATINHHLEQMAQAIFTEFCSEGENAVLSDILTVCYGKDHKRLDHGKIPCYGSGGIMRYVNEAIYSGESVLIPRKGSLNNVLYMNEPFWTVDTMFYTHMTRTNVAKFVYFTVRSLDLAGMNVGSAVPSMTTAVLNALEIVLPSNESLASFEKAVSPMFLQMQASNAESAHLAELRDTLLPRLMSGELSVADLTAAK